MASVKLCAFVWIVVAETALRRATLDRSMVTTRRSGSASKGTPEPEETAAQTPQSSQGRRGGAGSRQATNVKGTARKLIATIEEEEDDGARRGEARNGRANRGTSRWCDLISSCRIYLQSCSLRSQQ